MNKKSSLYKVFAIFIGLLSLETYSQHRPQYTQYMYNTMTVNPGYTGSLGLGRELINVTRGPASQDCAEANASYSISVPQTAQLRFGVKAGVKLVNVDFSTGSDLDPTAPLLSQNIDNKVNPTVGAGAYL